MQIETNTDWSVIETEIKITYAFIKYFLQDVHQFLCHIILGFESNYLIFKFFLSDRVRYYKENSLISLSWMLGQGRKR